MAVTRERMLDVLGNGPTGDARRPAMAEWTWIALVLVGAGWAGWTYGAVMDGYELAILAGSALALIAWGWHWRPARAYSAAVAALSLFAIGRYGDSLGAAQTDFFLKYLLASQQAFMWMSALYVLATVTYAAALVSRSDFVGRTASALTWAASVMGLAGLMVRWRESYLMGADIGHIPVSNLYEVFILFSVITALLYLYYEGRTQTRAMGAFVLLVISAAVGFLLWYTFDREAQHIQPLVPALQSYWMKIHVPANFIGYGAFSLAAMLGVVYLLAQPQQAAPALRRALWPAGALLIATGAAMVGWTFTHEAAAKVLRAWALLPVTAGLLVWVVAGQGRMTDRLPAPAVVDDILYKSIALGFAAFTVATILGALWAAEAWGGYWSWDPKETWALIVWLNYAAWLHLRLSKGLRGTPMAWWAIIGLFVTAFAFLGVNMWLSGLHSYGTL